ncbi:MAG: acyl-CoA dehydrogenase family protein [Candidatus Hydrogenedentota bacterium]|nr:MAG: acyl-CoA dehydrogenase family protein [Candidatus Hydrogenedentota bacterium]
MDLELTPHQKKLAADVAKFAAKEIAPGADERDRSGQFPRSLWRRMGEAGLLGLLVSSQYRGGGTDFLTTAVAFESFARYGHDMGLCASLTVTTLLCRFQLLRHANEEQRRKYLPAIATGEKIPAFAVSEEKRGSHPRYLETTAKHEGSCYVINGRKMYITNGPVADLVIVFAVTERFGDRNGISAFLVEKGTPGFSVGKIMDLDFCRSAPHSELVFEDCRVPEENLIGEKNTAFEKMVRGVRENEDSLGMATFAGLLQWQLELAAGYLKQQNRELSDDQLLLLSDFASTVEIARTIAYKVAWLRDARKETTAEFAACHFHFQKLADSAVGVLNDLFTTEEDLVRSGLERPLRDMKIALIGRNVANLRKQKLARQLMSGGGTLT